METETYVERKNVAKTVGAFAEKFGEGGVDVALAIAAAFRAGLEVQRESAARAAEEKIPAAPAEKKEG